MSKDLYAMALTVGQQSASMDGYLQAVSTIPMLKVEKEQELGRDGRCVPQAFLWGRALDSATNPEWQWLIFSWDSLTPDFHLVERPW
jgi:hypothetical protein